LWDRNSSKTYQVNAANVTTDIYTLDLEEHLGYIGKGRYGFDTVQIGWDRSGAKAENQTVVGIATKDYFMGLFGLNPQSTSYTGANTPVLSFMGSLKKNSVIPSLSWGYTAGNQYSKLAYFSGTIRGTGSNECIVGSKNGVHGSLTLGGYDSSKFNPNDVPFTMASEQRDLMVSIQKITTGTANTTLLPTSVNAFLDSAIPFIYLPAEACALFEKEFQLTWNETARLYVVPDTTHTLLQAKNPSITFNLGTPTKNVDITLPYAAFDLVATYPFTADDSTQIRYFPLRRANSTDQYTLGRTFFQEAYVIADYERGNFSVSQATFDGSTNQQLVAIYPIGGAPSNKKVPVAAIAGAIAGAIVIIALVLLYFFWWKPRHRKRNASELDSSNPLYHPLHPNSHQKDTNYIKAELDAGDDHLAAHARDGRFGKPVEVSGQQEIYEMDATGVPHEMHAGSRDSKRASWFLGKDRKRSSGIPSRQDTTDTFGFPRTPHSAHPSDGGDMSIQNTPAVNYAVPSPRQYGDFSTERYRDRTPSPRVGGFQAGPSRNSSTADNGGFPRSATGSLGISSAGSSLRVPPRSPGQRGGRAEDTPIVSPTSAQDRGEYNRF
jgi:hypothetical protein